MASLTGKGRKTRHVPLDGSTITLLAAYLEEHRLDKPGHDDHPVFFSQHRARLSRGGITWIIRKYQAQIRDPPLAGASISPHTLRHSKAMHLYEAGMPLPYIRDILGHVDLSTTEIYASASTEAKRKALEAAYQASSPTTCPNGTRTPASSTGSPACEPAIQNYAQCSTRRSAPTRASRPALRITRHCS